MNKKVPSIFKTRLRQKDSQKLTGIDNPTLQRFIAEYIELCNPSEVFVSTGSAEDIEWIRQKAIVDGEEKELNVKGHTVHFDGYFDQARDEKNTKFLLSKGVNLGPNINWIDKDEGLEEIRVILKNIMFGHRLYIQFFCLGPTNSEFSIPAVQLTDSSYVAHSQNLLYRKGYEEFKKLRNPTAFFKFVHSQGELENCVSKNIDKRRIYIDIDDNIIFSVNTQYGGNTIGHKKLAMRLAINRASKEYWLTEHMFLMGVHGPRGRVTYLTGAFPSLCGKTSTALLEGESIVGDDIVYLRVKNRQIHAVNVEKGIFGIIKGINSKEEPILWKALQSPGEIVFSNVLVTEENESYWTGKNGKVPKRGINYSDQWTLGKKDSRGVEIPPSHPNARFTLDMKLLENLDPNIDNPKGVVVGGIIYGGRDSDTWVPVEESFDWAHGVITKGASLESETTAAALGKEGVRKFNPMANLAFLSVSVGKYVENHLKFGATLKNQPPIFSMNYFLKDSKGEFLSDKADKKVWLKWIEQRSHKECGTIKTPTGLIPKYEDLKRLFKDVLNKDYIKRDYIRQFMLRVPAHLAKIDRIIEIYRTKVPNTPQIVFEILEAQRLRLIKVKEKYGDYVSPDKFIV